MPIGGCDPCRDLKPENLLFVEPAPRRRTLKLCDFGFGAGVALSPNPKCTSTNPECTRTTLKCTAVHCADRKLRDSCGTPIYMPPEIVRNAPHLGPPVDLWGVGAIIFEMASARPAFAAGTLDLLDDRIRRAAYQKLSRQASPRVQAVPAGLFRADLDGEEGRAPHARARRWAHGCSARVAHNQGREGRKDHLGRL